MAQRHRFSKRFRIVTSVLIIGHLLAILMPPLSFQARGRHGLSPSIATVLGFVERYSQFIYADRGYAFFAPDPGPSHLIQAAITGHNESRVELMYPDLQRQWPRLMYHRHFMLAEFLHEIYHPPGPPQFLIEGDPQEAQRWAQSRARYEHIRQSMVEHLRREHRGKDVSIRRIEHVIPDVVEFQREPIELTDPRLYQVLLDRPLDEAYEGTLAEPIGPPETVPPPNDATGDTSAGAMNGKSAAASEDRSESKLREYETNGDWDDHAVPVAEQGPQP